MEDKNTFIPLQHTSLKQEEMLNVSKSFYHFMDKRRSVRHFSNKEVPKEVIENIIMTASSAPSGAHKQPWTFCAISSLDMKKKIREAAEHEEYLNYKERMSEQWLKDLEPFDTNWKKPMLEIAPWLIVVFRRSFEQKEDGKYKNYYVNESVGLAAGFLLTAIHNAGLVALTHTPSPMGFLAEVLERPKNERAFLLIPVGYPAENCQVPDLTRKSLDEVAVFY